MGVAQGAVAGACRRSASGRAAAQSAAIGQNAPAPSRPYIYASVTATLGNVTSIPVTPVPMGKSWVVSQVAFTILPATTVTTAQASLTLNGRLLYGLADANGGYVQGPPYVTLSAGDAFLVTGTGIPASSTMIIELFYNEYPAGQVPNSSNTV